MKENKINDIIFQSMFCLSKEEHKNKLLVNEWSELYYFILSELTLQMNISQAELSSKLIRHCAFLAYRLLTEKKESFTLEENMIDLIIKRNKVVSEKIYTLSKKLFQKYNYILSDTEIALLIIYFKIE